MLTALLLAATVHTYVSERCGFSFDYPASWTVVENPKAQVTEPDGSDKLAECAVGLRPPRWPREIPIGKDVFVLNRYPVRVVKWNRGFRESAEATFFTRVGEEGGEGLLEGMKPGEWGMFARQSIVPARMFVTACCQGVRGESWGHGYGKRYEQTGEKVTIVWEGAVVNDRKGHSIVIESDRAGEFTAVVTQIIESVRFHSTGF